MSHFEKVSFAQYAKDVCNLTDMIYGLATDMETIENAYESIKLPTRGTKFSAGYDFVLPMPIRIESLMEEKLLAAHANERDSLSKIVNTKNQIIKIPTGIRVKLEPDEFMMILPRSSYGFKYHTTLLNTAGIIDSDYYGSYNEGHIIVGMMFDMENELRNGLSAGEKFCQGIIMKYQTVEDDSTTTDRVGGFGSTGK